MIDSVTCKEEAAAPAETPAKVSSLQSGQAGPADRKLCVTFDLWLLQRKREAGESDSDGATAPSTPSAEDVKKEKKKKKKDKKIKLEEGAEPEEAAEPEAEVS